MLIFKKLLSERSKEINKMMTKVGNKKMIRIKEKIWVMQLENIFT